MLLEELLHGQELEPNAFENVHVVHSQEHGFAFVLGPELRRPPPGGLAFEAGRQLPHVHAHRHDLDAHRAPIVLQPNVPPLGFVDEAQHAAAARQEVPGVVEGVEAHELGIEEGAQSFFRHRKRPVNFRGREGVVQEEVCSFSSKDW